jgi:glycosyltransferase involved in cell wall biosynthesis
VLLGIDADLVGKNRSGNETYTRGIVAGLGAVLDPVQMEILVAGSDVSSLATIDTGSCERRILPTRPGLLGDLTLGRSLRRAGASCVLASYNAPLGFSPARARAGTPTPKAAIATVIHDLAFQRVPETFPAALRYRLELSVARSVRVSDLVVTVSEFSRSELLERYPKLAPERVVVTPDAAGGQFRSVELTEHERAHLASAYDLPAEFVLAVGNLQPRKNLPRLIEATDALGVPLVVVGQPLWKSRSVAAAISSSSCRWLGYVPEGDLPGLYAMCSAFAYPSLYEGFGLPIIEAMAAGAPVLTSDCGAMREVAGNAGLLVDPDSVEAIRDGLEQLLGDSELNGELRRRGAERASQFTWESSARELAGAMGLPLRDDAAGRGAGRGAGGGGIGG